MGSERLGESLIKIKILQVEAGLFKLPCKELRKDLRTLHICNHCNVIYMLFVNIYNFIFMHIDKKVYLHLFK